MVNTKLSPKRGLHDTPPPPTNLSLFLSLSVQRDHVQSQCNAIVCVLQTIQRKQQEVDAQQPLILLPGTWWYIFWLFLQRTEISYSSGHTRTSELLPTFAKFLVIECSLQARLVVLTMILISDCSTAYHWFYVPLLYALHHQDKHIKNTVSACAKHLMICRCPVKTGALLQIWRQRDKNCVLPNLSAFFLCS